MSDNTPHIQHLLSEYFDALLPEQEHLAVASHIKDCAECEKCFQELVLLRKFLHEQPSLTPPSGFYSGIVNKIKGEDSFSGAFFATVQFKVLVSACIVMVVVWVSMDGVSRFHFRKADLPAPAAPQPVREVPLVDQKTRDMTKVESEKMAPVNEVAPALKEEVQAPPKAPEVQKKAPVPAEHREIALKKKSSGRQKQSHPVALRKDVALQARNTSGQASQGSFSNPPSGLGAKAQSTGKSAQLVEFESSVDKTLPSDFIEWKGVDSGIKKFRIYVIQTPAQMKDVWRKHSPNDAAPEVDFEKFQVVGVTTGQTHITGTGYEIIGSRDTVDATIVYYRERKDMFRAQPSVAGFRPYHFKVIPKSKLPVKFQQI